MILAEAPVTRRQAFYDACWICRMEDGNGRKQVAVGGTVYKYAVMLDKPGGCTGSNVEERRKAILMSTQECHIIVQLVSVLVQDAGGVMSYHEASGRHFIT
jgi:hypothetical protein